MREEGAGYAAHNHTPEEGAGYAAHNHTPAGEGWGLLNREGWDD